MSASDLQKKGYPTAASIQDFEYTQYCGGAGAGVCPLLVPDRLVYKVKNSRFTTYNRMLLIYNENFEVYSDGGASTPSPCRSEGVLKNVYMMAVADPDAVTNADVMAQGSLITDPIPYYLTFEADDLPQPIDPAFDGFTYIVVTWEGTGVVWSYALAKNEDGEDAPAMQTVDYQQDLRI